jgi:hypothetical protein
MELNDKRLSNLKMLVVLSVSCFLRYLSYEEDFKNLIKESGEYMGLKYLSIRK